MIRTYRPSASTVMHDEAPCSFSASFIGRRRSATFTVELGLELLSVRPMVEPLSVRPIELPVRPKLAKPPDHAASLCISGSACAIKAPPAGQAPGHWNLH